MGSATINLRHLYVICEIARLGSINSAARVVHLSQPAVTQAVASVERWFAAALFKRSNAGVSLTPAGEAAVARIQRAMEQLSLGAADLSGSPPLDGRHDAHIARLITAAQLNALSAVVEHRSFTLAARAEHISQPTIHRAARALERILGASLFEKTSFGVLPTRDAERLARRARLAFAEIAHARAEVAALSGGGSGSTLIGAMPLVRSYLLPRALIDFTNEYPDHGVSMMEGTYANLLAALRSGAADFLIGAMRDPALIPDVEQQRLFDDPLAIFVRPGHPLANKRRVTAAMLRKFPWVAARSGAPLRGHFDELFTNAGLTPPVHPIECNSLIAARALLLESDRVMLLSRHQAHYELQSGLLVALPHPQGRVVRAIGLTMRRDWLPTKAQQRLLELLRERAVGTDSLS